MKRISRGWIRANVVIQIFAAFCLLAAVNYLAFEFSGRVDFSRSQKFALSEQTKRVIRELKQPLNITVFFSRTTISPVSALDPDVRNLLKEFVFSGRKQIHVEYVDPVRDLTRAREVQARHKFRADENVLILEYDGRTAFLPVAQMADFDLNALSAGGEARVLAFKGEAALMSAMIGLVSPGKKKVYFLEGHGEPPVTGNSALSTFRDYITRQNVEVAPLSLAAMDVIPADAAAVFLIAPTADLEEREVQILRQYWEGQGKLMVLLEPSALTPRLDAFSAGVGLAPRNDRVLRTVRLGFATGILREVTAEFLPENPITRRLAGLSLFLPGETKSIAMAPDSPTGPLLQPVEEFWGEVDFVTDDQQGVRYDEGRDTGQPLYVGALATGGRLSAEGVQVETAKFVIVGNAQFALDAALSAQGLDFLVSATHWLLERGHLTGIAPKVTRYFPLNLTDRQLGLLSLISLILMPAAAAILAIILAVGRRS
jgi:hypothetical protein